MDDDEEDFEDDEGDSDDDDDDGVDFDPNRHPSLDPNLLTHCWP